ncbi:site-specific integrase [Alistipes communis]|uniref:site-specific integrase n=1 Tax=Alistipes communis TaxID=2585118 RepID=UPI001E4E557C|nr:site-specific integrase [Alistipes communis]
MAFTDVQQLKPEHIVLDINGMQWFRKPRQKTGNMCNIPLMDKAQEILLRYREDSYCLLHGVLLPVCSNQKMNAYLKELADICGIRKRLSTHTARHTFATLTLASGATLDNVAKMLGHSNTNMTRHYARILDSSIMRNMQTVAKAMDL